ncbi:SMI1/KNR4 family protein (plasmid) [Gordonia terrae]|nr:SMI1/KNR4 family protein [Gordonia terrae]
MERAVAVGGGTGLGASPEQIAAAEQRLGVRFDRVYRRLMSVCNGIERLGPMTLFSVDELGTSQRWRNAHQFMHFEYFLGDPPSFEMRGETMVEPEFYPPPAGRRPVVIGYDELFPTQVLCNFSIDDPDAEPSEVAMCRYEPWLTGTLNHALASWVDDAESWLREENGLPSDSLHDAITSLQHAITGDNVVDARRCLSARWRATYDHHAPIEMLDDLRTQLWPHGSRPTPITPVPDPPASPVTVPVEFTRPGWTEPTITATLGAVIEHHVWRIDSWTWHTT